MSKLHAKYVTFRWWVLIAAALIGVIGGEIAYQAVHSTHTNDRHNTLGDGSATRTPVDIRAVATIPVGKSPEGIAIDPSAHRLYITNAGDDSVSVIDTTTDTVNRTVAVGKLPRWLAVDPSSHTLYVTNTGGNSVSVIDTTTDSVTATIPVPPTPYGLAVDSLTHALYVATSEELIVIDTTSRTVTDSYPFPGGHNPFEVAFEPDTATLYVTDALSPGAVTEIDTATRNRLKTIPASDTPMALAVDQGTHTVYTANPSGAGTVLTEIDFHTDSPVTIPIGSRRSGGIAIAPDTHTVYLTTGNYAPTGDTVTVVDPNARKVTATVPVGRNAYGPVLDTGSHTLFTANKLDNTVSVIKFSP